MSQILVTIPDQVASAFINHLAKLEPRIANQITIRVLEDSTNETNGKSTLPSVEVPPMYIGPEEWSDDWMVR